jgi:hypothetical protein
MTHPDQYDGLLKWPMYGPRDSEIADLVDKLAAQGLRLSEIEAAIKQALVDLLAGLKEKARE